MAITVDAVSSLGPSSVSAVFPHTVGTGPALPNKALFVLVASFGNTNAVTVCTYNSLPLTLVGIIANNGARTEVWRLVNPPSGIFNVSLTLSEVGMFVAGSISFFGVDQTAPVAFTSSSGGFGSPASSGSVGTPDHNDFMIFACSIVADPDPPPEVSTGSVNVYAEGANAGNPSPPPPMGFGIFGAGKYLDITGNNSTINIPFGSSMVFWSGLAVVVNVFVPTPVGLIGFSDGSSSDTASVGTYMQLVGTSNGKSTAVGQMAEASPLEVVPPSVQPSPPSDPYNPPVGNTKLVAKNMSWAPNQARILTLEHAIRFDDVDNRLTMDAQVIYTDPDLGTVFVGRIFEIERKGESGEGVIYRATDIMRFMHKTPARIVCNLSEPPYSDPPLRLGTTRLHILEGTEIDDCLSEVLSSIMLTGWNFLPLGLDYGLLPGLTLYKALDKGGMSIGTWIDDILDQTEGGVAYIVPVLVLGNWLDKLVVADFYAQPSVTLTIGEYEDAVPLASEPLVVSMDLKESTDNKFYKVTVEGGGDWERKVGAYIAPLICSIGGNPPGPACYNPPQCDNWVTRFRFYFEETNVFGFHFVPNTDENPCEPDRICRKEIKIEFDAQITQGDPPQSFFQHFTVLTEPALDREDIPCNAAVGPNLNKCRWYVQVDIVQGGVGSLGQSMPGSPIISNVEANYTVYRGSVVAQAPLGPFDVPEIKLLRQGEYVIQRPELFKFLSPGVLDNSDPPNVVETAENIDPVPELQGIADLYYTRYSKRTNVSGSLVVHIKGITGNLRPGSRLPQLGSNVRIRSLQYDFVARNISMEVSDLPLRDFMNEFKDTKVGKQMLHKNWRDREPVQISVPCFPTLSLHTDPDCPCLSIDQYPSDCGYT